MSKPIFRIQPYKDVDISRIDFLPLKDVEIGNGLKAKELGVNYTFGAEGTGPIRVRLPKCFSLGFSEFTDKVSGKNSYTLGMSLDTNIPEQKAAIDFIMAVYNKIADHLAKLGSEKKLLGTGLKECKTAAAVKKYLKCPLTPDTTQDEDGNLLNPGCYKTDENGRVFFNVGAMVKSETVTYPTELYEYNATERRDVYFSATDLVTTKIKRHYFNITPCVILNKVFLGKDNTVIWKIFEGRIQRTEAKARSANIAPDEDDLKGVAQPAVLDDSDEGETITAESSTEAITEEDTDKLAAMGLIDPEPVKETISSVKKAPVKRTIKK
jgi:hypothetical protein